MKDITLARSHAQAGDTAAALGAYHKVLLGADGTQPDLEMEAACYFFDHGGDYRVAYIAFQSLYNRGQFQDILFPLMVQAFYAPNVKDQARTYQRNCKLLGAYPYLFRKDFPAFDDLPVKLFPYDDEGFVPFDARADRFGEYCSPGRTVISRNFFHDLEQPVFAADVYSQYELCYLKDNVRRSDWVGRENHIYLHYTDWGTFCSYLQWLDFRDLVKEEKFVFLIEEEEALYPIDFKERFGLDYSSSAVKPVGIREVKKLIWHTQLSSHNGGDFFNEIFYGHPNILALESLMFDVVVDMTQKIARALRRGKEEANIAIGQEQVDPKVLQQLSLLKDITEKDVLVAIFLGCPSACHFTNPADRIVPALFFQPHFSAIHYELSINARDQVIPLSQEYDAIRQSPLFKGFPYIKTFSPLRRLTTSYAATVRFMEKVREERDDTRTPDMVVDRVLNRSFMADPKDRLLRDGVLVRFEDGKLNPRATFAALAAFVDLPYTESMTYCSGREGMNPESYPGNTIGFDPATVYRTYEAYGNDAERAFIEYFMRDVYEAYGYDFQYYDGGPVDEERAKEWIAGFTTLNGHMRASLQAAQRKKGHISLRNNKTNEVILQVGEKELDRLMDSYLEGADENRMKLVQNLSKGLRFVNRQSQPLQMMPLLKLDPALLEQPLYR